MKKLMLAISASFILPFGILASSHGNPGGHMIESWDQNGDGKVTLEDVTEKRGYIFISFDSNEDGFIDAEEYKSFDEARANDQASNGSGGKGEGRAQKGMTLEFNDGDNDGKVSEAEFLEHSADWLALMDRNGDSEVTTDDFGSGY